MPSEGINLLWLQQIELFGKIPKRKLGNLNKFKCKRAAEFYNWSIHEVSSNVLNFRFYVERVCILISNHKMLAKAFIAKKYFNRDVFPDKYKV